LEVKEMLNSQEDEKEVKEEEMTKPKKKRKTHRKKTSKGGFWDEVEKFLGIKRTRKRKKK
jgi:hypothetical protein